MPGLFQTILPTVYAARRLNAKSNDYFTGTTSHVPNMRIWPQDSEAMLLSVTCVLVKSKVKMLNTFQWNVSFQMLFLAVNITKTV